MRGIFAHVERIVETVIPQLGNAVVGQLCIRQQRRDDPVRLNIDAQARDPLAECAERIASVRGDTVLRDATTAGTSRDSSSCDDMGKVDWWERGREEFET